MATQSTDAAIAYEMTLAAGSGHVVSWATGTPPPPHAETQAAASVGAVDKLAETQGMLGAVYSALAAGQELDQLTREWRDRIEDEYAPDLDAGGAGDAGYDTRDGGGSGGTYEGSVVRVSEFSDPSSGCEVRETVTVYVTIGAFAGSGTEADPYTGDVDLFGQIDTVHTGPYAHCTSQTVIVEPTETRQ